MKKFVAFQIMIALVIGALIGHFFPDFGMALRPIGDGFIRLIKMIVVPIVFSTIVIGAAGSGGMKKMGSLGLKTIIWFEVITTIVLGIGLLLANVLKPGVGLDFSQLAKKDIGELDGYTQKVVDFKQMVLDIIPTNIID
ncbi:cation:dicarboxylase symporter family transporter, partial [Bacillus altitudinis]|nr:cation:dicarboxylase symporter family transporter [Bacillus altitudinis]